MGGTPGVAQALEIAQDRSLRARGIGHDAGLSRNSAPVERGELARARVQSIGWAAEHHRTQNQSRSKRRAARCPGLCRTIHYVKTNKAGTIRIFKKYMRGSSEEDLGTWLDESRESLNPSLSG